MKVPQKATGWLVLILLTLFTIHSASAAEKTAADILPASTVAYAEIVQPKPLIDTLLDHPLRKRVEALEGYRKAYASPEFLQFKFVLGIIEGRLGTGWREELTALTEGGIYVGVDAEPGTAALLVKSRDAKTLEKFRDVIFELARGDAQQHGRPDPIKVHEYRGVPAYQIDKGLYAVVGPWLLLVNRDTLMPKLIDNYLDADKQGLAGDASFKSARAAARNDTTAWLYVNMNTVRQSPDAKKAFAEKTDNPPGEILVGGILAALGQASYATASLDIKADGVRLALAAPFDPQSVAAPRQFYFGPGAQGEAPGLLAPSETLFSLSAYRDFAGLWSAADELFTENVSSKFEQAEGQLSTLLSGRSFSRDILGVLRPEFQFVATRPTFIKGDTPEPAIKVPAFALQFRLKDAENLQRQLGINFQSLVGFANIAGAQNAQPVLELSNEKRPSGKLLSAAYMPAVSDKLDEPGRIHFNFSPSLAFAGDRMILSSNKTLAIELMDQAAPAAAAPAADTIAHNTRASLSARIAGQMLRDNRQHLVAQNMLEKGHIKAEAEQEIDGVLDLLSVLKDFSIELDHDAKSLWLEAAVKIGN